MSRADPHVDRLSPDAKHRLRRYVLLARRIKARLAAEAAEPEQPDAEAPTERHGEKPRGDVALPMTGRSS